MTITIGVSSFVFLELYCWTALLAECQYFLESIEKAAEDIFI
jgi:hypothetical protein